MVKRLPTMWEMRVQSLDWEDLLEKEIATHSSILAWEIPWIEEPGGLQSIGLQRVSYNLATKQQQRIRPGTFSVFDRCSPRLFNLYAEYIMQNARLNKPQGGIKIARTNINNLRYADDNTLTT